MVGGGCKKVAVGLLSCFFYPCTLERCEPINSHAPNPDCLTANPVVNNRSKYGLLSFHLSSHPEEVWTKSDTSAFFNATTEQRKSMQLVGGIFVLRACNYTRWLMEVRVINICRGEGCLSGGGGWSEGEGAYQMLACVMSWLWALRVRACELG